MTIETSGEEETNQVKELLNVKLDREPSISIKGIDGFRQYLETSKGVGIVEENISGGEVDDEN